MKNNKSVDQHLARADYHWFVFRFNIFSLTYSCRQIELFLSFLPQYIATKVKVQMLDELLNRLISAIFYYFPPIVSHYHIVFSRVSNELNETELD